MAPHGPRRVVKYVVWTLRMDSPDSFETFFASMYRATVPNKPRCCSLSREAIPTRRAGVRRVFGAARNSHFASVDAGERVEALLATVRAIRGRAGSRRQNAVDGSR